MADFETLIRKALAKQDANDDRARAKVYNSSRSALQRMLASKPGLNPDVIRQRQMVLEQSISKIEAEFTGSADTGRENPPQVNGRKQDITAQGHVSEINMGGGVAANVPQADTSLRGADRSDISQNSAPEVNIGHANIAHDNNRNGPRTARAPLEESAAQDDVADQSAVVEPVYEETLGSEDFAAAYRAKRNAIRWLGILGLLLVLALVGWVGYLLVSSLAGGITVDAEKRPITRVSPVNRIDGSSEQNYQYITLLESGDPSAIVTDGRGKASIVDDQNQTMLRLVSLRSNSDKSVPAEPMLLELKPGVLEQISGRKVTVEILAKSGSAGPATFAVECDLGDFGSCGRKRFRVGLQPEAVVFSMDIKDATGSGDPAFLAISTDIASTANLTGKGDVLDIISARIRVVEDGQ